MVTSETARSQFSLGPWALHSDLGGRSGRKLYQARHRLHGFTALLKVLSPDDSRDKDVRDKFVTEARIATGSPEQILRTYELATYEGCLVAAMEFPRGTVLSKLALPIDLESVVSICVDIAHALAIMHRQGFANGAVRSSAVLLPCDSEPGVRRAKLLDLGLCLRFGSIPAPSQLQEPHSLAPENAWGQPVDSRTDVYGLAGLCFELLSATSWRAGAESCLVGRVPETLANTLSNCLAFDPADRPAAIGELADALVRARAEARSAIEAANAWPQDNVFGEHSAWFVDDSTVLSEDQRVSLFGYASQNYAVRNAVSLALVSLAIAGALGVSAAFALMGGGG